MDDLFQEIKQVIESIKQHSIGAQNVYNEFKKIKELILRLEYSDVRIDDLNDKIDKTIEFIKLNKVDEIIKEFIQLRSLDLNKITIKLNEIRKLFHFYD